MVLTPGSPEHQPAKRPMDHVTSPSHSHPADTSLTSLNLGQGHVGRNKQLRGGVYSSPMPIARHKVCVCCVCVYMCVRGREGGVSSSPDKRCVCLFAFACVFGVCKWSV